MPNGDVRFTLNYLADEGVVERVDDDRYRFIGGDENNE